MAPTPRIGAARVGSRAATVAVITSAGIAVPAAVVATQQAWTDIAYASSGCGSGTGYRAYDRVYQRDNSAPFRAVDTKFAKPDWNVYHLSSNFFNETQWVVTDWSKTSDPLIHYHSPTWVEAGEHYGIFSSSHHASFELDAGYWADSRGPGKGYFNHSLPQIYANHASSWYSFSINRASRTENSWNIVGKVYSTHGTALHTETGESKNDPHTETAAWDLVGAEDTCYPHSHQYLSVLGVGMSMRSNSGAWGKGSVYGVLPKGSTMYLHWETGKTGSKFSIRIPT